MPRFDNLHVIDDPVDLGLLEWLRGKVGAEYRENCNGMKRLEFHKILFG